MANYQNHQDVSRLPKNSSGRVIIFKTLVEKANWLDAAASLDAMRKAVQEVAFSRFCQIRDPEMRTRQIHRFVRDKIRYERDFQLSRGAPGEEFADSSVTLQRGFGDCDDKARLFVALMRAAELIKPIGTAARIRAVFRRHPLDFVHVQADSMFYGSKRIKTSDPDGWVLTELILKGCELGQNPDDCPRGPKGERVLA